MEKDCLCVKRSQEGVTKVENIHKYLGDEGLLNIDNAAWAHSRQQPAKGPRKLQGGQMRLIPEHANLTDQTVDTVGQLIPIFPLKSLAVLYELKHNGQQLQRLNGLHAAVLCTSKRYAIPCLRVVRMNVAQ